MDEKALFRAKTWLEQPPRWADPDHISDKLAAEYAASWNAAAASTSSGVRSSI